MDEGLVISSQWRDSIEARSSQWMGSISKHVPQKSDVGKKR